MSHAEDSPSGLCKQFEQDLVLYHYGESTETEHGCLEAHLAECASCRDFLDDLQRVLPITAKMDDPPRAFWQSYSRELSEKLTALETKHSWWNTIFSLFRERPVPLMTAALVFIVVLSMTYVKDLWQPPQRLPQDKVPLEVQSIAEDPDFLKALDLLDSLDLLEAVDAKIAKPQDA